jgi:hypothetical protein
MSDTDAQPHDAFFAVAYDDREVPERIPRDRWKRPLIKHPETGELVAYTRASTLGEYIANKGGLHIWDVRNVVRGMGIREDLGWMAAALPALVDDKKKDGPTNARLSEIADEARIAAGADKKANWGTAVHGFTEPEQRGIPFGNIPEVMREDVASYWAAIDEVGLVPLASEVFVVCDELQVAGTFDDLYWSFAYGVVVGDKKSGKQDMHKTLIQLAVYANGQVYDPETGERSPLTSLLPEEFRSLVACPSCKGTGDSHDAETNGRCWDCRGTGEFADILNREHALYVHIPKGEKRTEFYELDIVLGYEAAQHAAWVGKYQKRKDLVVRAGDKLIAGVESARADVMQHIPNVQTREDLRKLFKEYESVWTDELTKAGKIRLQEIQEAYNAKS